MIVVAARAERGIIACKYRRRDHKKRYPDCHVPDDEAEVLAREREVPPDVRKEKRRQKERERIAEKRLLDKVRYNLSGKIRSPNVALSVARHPKRNISPETILTTAVKPQKPRKSPLLSTYNLG